MTTFYHVQVGALETQEFRTTPIPFWLVCFSDTGKDHCAKCSSSSCCLTGRLLSRAWRNDCKRRISSASFFFTARSVWNSFVAFYHSREVACGLRLVACKPQLTEREWTPDLLF
jgi:hypothetical protein